MTIFWYNHSLSDTFNDKDPKIRASAVGSFLHKYVELIPFSYVYHSLLLWKNARFIYLKTYEYCPRTHDEGAAGRLLFRPEIPLMSIKIRRMTSGDGG